MFECDVGIIGQSDVKAISNFVGEDCSLSV